MLEWKITERYANLAEQVMIHDTEAPIFEARLATQLIERWGLVVGTDGGEDSSGRAKLRHSTPQEVVDRACDTAALAVEQFRARGWFVQLPTLDEIAARGKPKD
jgi:hypothetical protein